MTDGTMRGWTQAPDGTWLPPASPAPGVAPAGSSADGPTPAQSPVERAAPANEAAPADEAAPPESPAESPADGTAPAEANGTQATDATDATDGIEAPVGGQAAGVSSVADRTLPLAAGVAATRPLPIVKPRSPAPAARPVAAAAPPGERRWETGHLIGVGIVCLVIGGFIGNALADNGSTKVASTGTTLGATTTTLSPDDPRFAPREFSSTSLPGFGQNQSPNQNAGLGSTATTSLFGAAAAGAVGAGAGAAGGTTVPSSRSAGAAALTSFVGEGTFRVGVDIQPGTYRTAGPTAAGTTCYWERQAVFGDSTSVIDSRNETGEAIVDIDPTDKGFRTSRCQRWDRVR